LPLMLLPRGLNCTASPCESFSIYLLAQLNHLLPRIQNRQRHQDTDFFRRPLSPPRLAIILLACRSFAMCSESPRGCR
jgi:hypothetical protein